MGIWRDLLGTLQSKFQLGIGGPQLKNNSAVIEARNAADNAYTQLRALCFQTYGNDFILNNGAAESGADWKMTLSRPSSGMTHDLQFIYPSIDPSPGMALTVTSLSGNIVTLNWTAVDGGAEKIGADSTTLSFGSTSPLAMYTNPALSVVRSVKIIIDTPFTGSPSLSIGISGTTSKYLGSTQVDLTAAGTTVFEVDPGIAANSSSESLIATYSAGGAGAGLARIEVAYAVPS